MLFSNQCIISNAKDTDTCLLVVDWSTDYTNENDVILNIDIESDAGYIQTVSVAMFDDDFDALSTDNKPGFNDYYRMDEVTLKKGEVATVKFSITNEETPLDDGAYKILIQGSGIDAEKSTVQLPVWVIKPSKIPGIISNFNGADTSDLMTYIEQVKNPLKLEVSNNVPMSRLNGFLGIRLKDYNKFTTLNDIENAWRISEIISELSLTTPDKTILKNLIEANAESIGIDVKNADYKSNIDRIYNCIVYNNNINKASYIDEIKILFDNAVAIESINCAGETTIFKKFADYYKNLDISDENYNKFAQCKDSQIKLKIARMFLDKDFKTAEQIKGLFDDAVDEHIPDSSAGGQVSSGNAGGVSGSPVKDMGGSVGAGVSGNVPQGNKNTFNDCNSDHWAYTYIMELKQANIVSGYSDGCFYPDKQVKREEFVKMVVLIADLYNSGSKCSFNDVPANEWYYPYVASAYENGIVNGVSDNAFGVGNNVSRQDVAVIICRLLERYGVKVDSTGVAKTFSDNADIADYATESVKTLTGMSVLNG